MTVYPNYQIIGGPSGQRKKVLDGTVTWYYHGNQAGDVSWDYRGRPQIRRVTHYPSENRVMTDGVC